MRTGCRLGEGCAPTSRRQRMIRFALLRFLGLVATVFVAAILIFVMLDLLPGDPARFILGLNAAPEAIDALRQQLGLDASPFERFFRWLGGMLTGNFGVSAAHGQPANLMLGGALSVTLPLIVLSALLSALIGLPVGVLAGLRRGSMADRALMVLARIGIATPNFWFGMLLVLLFSVTLRWFPPGGFVPWTENPLAAFGSLILPTLALALPQAAVLARATRDTLVEVQGSDYIRAARAKGLTLREAVRSHGMRNALLPMLKTLGIQFAYLIAGTVIVENVFYLPGLGRLILDAIAARDLIVVRSGVLMLVLAMAVVVFLADLATAWTDPRSDR